MALDPAGMTDEIVLNLPSEWQAQWSSDTDPPKEWMLAFCTDTVAMWSTLVLAPGIAAAHVHIAASPIVAVSTAMTSIIYTGSLTVAYFTAIATVVATHISTQLSMNSAVGSATHDHILPAVPPGAATPAFAPFAATVSTLEASLVSAAQGVNVLGALMPDQGDVNSLNIIFGAYAAGFLGHVEANATLVASIDTGTGHTHAIL